MRKVKLCLVVVVAVFALVVPLPTFAAQPLEKAPDVVVSVSQPPGQVDCVPAGYSECAVRINNTAESPQTIELFVNTLHGQVSRISRRVLVQGNSSAVVPLYVPPVALRGRLLRVEVNGKFGGDVDLRLDQEGYYDQSDILLVSDTVSHFRDVWRKMFPNSSSSTRYRPPTTSRSAPTKRFVPAEIADPISAWSTNWLAYTAYAAVVVTAEEYRSAPGAVTLALERYIETGGTVVVTGDYQPPASWFTGQNEGSFGKAYHKGFGQLLTVSRSDPQNWPDDYWTELSNYWGQTVRPFRYERDSSRSTENSRMPVVEERRMPVKSLFCVVLVFAILVGPINTLVFARGKHRMRIYWTVPLFSLGATVAIVTVSLISEGITARVRSASVVYLDENAHRASIISHVGYYCPLPPWTLSFSNDIQLKCLTLGEEWDSEGRRIDFTDGQHYANWISARLPEFFVSRSSRTCRDRLSLRYEASGATSIVNGLPGNITRLWLVAPDGTLHTGDDIAAGQSAVLKRYQEPPPGPSSEIRSPLSDIYGSERWHGLGSDELHLGSWLAPGRYIAVMDTNPYAEVGFDGYRSLGAECVVFGILNRESSKRNE